MGVQSALLSRSKYLSKRANPELLRGSSLLNAKDVSETEHPSQKDSYSHYTTVFQDKDGNHIKTKHVYPK